MKSLRCLDIPEKHEVILPVEASSDRFAIWRVGRERWGPKFRFREPHLDLLFCGLVLSGQLEQDGGPDGVQRVGPGEMVLNGAGGPRSLAVRLPPGVEILVLDASKGAATKLAKAAFPPLPVSFPVGEVGEMESLFLRLLREAHGGGPDAGRICGCLGEALLLKAAQACREHTGRHSRRERQFLRARRYVLDRLAEPLTVSGVARAVGVSREYLHRLFRQYEGEPPQTWIQRHRIAYAANLLQGQGRSVKQVARALGWDDPYAFSRAFKRVTGVPPSQMLRRRPERRP